MATSTTLDVTPAPLGLWRLLSRPTLYASGLAVIAAASGLITYAAVTGLVPYRPSHAGLYALIALNVLLVATLGLLIAWRLTRLWAARRSAGTQLQMRLVGQFAVIAVVPAILIAAFGGVIVNQGVEGWFSPRVKGALGNAVNVAQRYVQEHERSIVADAYEIASSIQYDPELFDANRHVRPDVLFAKLATVTRDRSLQASYILNSKAQILGSTKQRFLPDLKPPSPAEIAQASRGTVVIDANSRIGNSKIGVVRALIRLQALNDAYLLVVRTVDPKVLAYYQNTVSAVSEYKRLERDRSQIQLLFAAIYGVVSLLTLLGAIWLGIWAANRLGRPIAKLIGAAEEVSTGNLRARVAVERNDDEMALLGRTFNRMTSQLEAQRSELVDANRQIDARRRFTEAVLAGVSAGVIGLDGEGRVTIVNRAAARLLDAAPEEMEGQHYAEAVPELAGLIRRAVQEPVGRASGEATVKRAGKNRTLSVQAGREAGEAGYIVTFDDITDLVSAQRTAAWADVARRIAHEIKNPLTPIQLSAERLKRKYLREVETDPEIFQQCTDTIIRQVGDIGRMVDEFSSFARMPAPQIRRENAHELLQQAIFPQRVANPSIAFSVNAPRAALHVECDGRLIIQALTNVLKNGAEAIEARLAKGDDTPGTIATSLEIDGDRLVICVIDNGIGLPADQRHRLTEPYVTTRVKGTGLGLAIVRKVFEDHGGDLSLTDAGEESRGAEVRMTLPLRAKSSRTLEKDNFENEQDRLANPA
ncbi:MAG: PAS domain-containing sensor histidine kinase [Alphaproteobacteria bacterium]|nr:PAS domain-containing sensor histidine kinase [Alphaproteobacteria bacterium]